MAQSTAGASSVRRTPRATGSGRQTAEEDDEVLREIAETLESPPQTPDPPRTPEFQSPTPGPPPQTINLPLLDIEPPSPRDEGDGNDPPADVELPAVRGEGDERNLPGGDEI